MALYTSNGGLAANISQRALKFTSKEEYDDWVKALAKPEDINNFIILEAFSNRQHSLIINGEFYPLETFSEYITDYGTDSYLKVNELVIYKGDIYRSLKEHYTATDAPPSKENKADWEYIPNKQEIYPDYKGNESIPVDSLVIKNHELYRSRKAIVPGTPITDDTFFEKISLQAYGVYLATYADASLKDKNKKITVKNYPASRPIMPGTMISVTVDPRDSSTWETLEIVGLSGKVPIKVAPLIWEKQRALTREAINAQANVLFQYEISPPDGERWEILNPFPEIKRHFVLDITLADAFDGTLTVTSIPGGTMPYNVPPNGKNLLVPVDSPDTEYTISCQGFTQKISTTNKFGVYPVHLEKTAEIFSDASWAEINRLSTEGKIPLSWKIGDSKNITLTTGEVLEMQIYGKNHDDLTSGGKAGLTLGAKLTMTEKRKIHTDTAFIESFVKSEIYTWLQGDFYNSLPEELKPFIKTVNKTTALFSGDDATLIRTDPMKIFLLSEVECYGKRIYSLPGEGQAYPIYTTDKSREKENDYWLRSPSIKPGTVGYIKILFSGIPYLETEKYSRGVVPLFCI